MSAGRAPMPERLQALLFLNGLGLIVAAVLVGWAWFFQLLGEIVLWPIPGHIEVQIPGDARAWRVIVEGAGGWRVPLHPRGFLSDLPEHLGLGVILVVGLRLGCLNHARLTFEVIERTGHCPFIGWIGNRIDPGFEHQVGTLATLARLLGSPALALVPALLEPTAARAVEHLDQPVLRDALQPPA